MIVAEIEITTAGSDGYGYPTTRRVRFSNLEEASRELARIADLIQRCKERANDIPILYSVKAVNELTVPSKDIVGVSLVEFAKWEAEHEGVKEAYPKTFGVPPAPSSPETSK